MMETARSKRSPVVGICSYFNGRVSWQAIRSAS
jgi:hypothetical protein